MTQAQRVVDAIKHSGVGRVAIVDDAFDPPDFLEEHWGAVLEFFLAEGSDAVRRDAQIDEQSWQSAIDAISSSAYRDETLSEVIRRLYAAFVDSFNAKFDPAGRFKIAKGSNLENVRPLISLIRRCKPDVEILTYGAEVGDTHAEDGAHVVFVDLFLDPDIAADADPGTQTGANAVRASLDRIAPLMTQSPSVILMSSHSHRPEAESYREQIKGGGVYASRFAFIEKTKITQQAANDIKIEHDACDALLDIFQTYRFGRGLHCELQGWVESARAAIEALANEIQHLELRDISYLVRFRLAAEGQSLPDYLEWLLAECLIDELGKQLNERADSPEMAALTGDEATRIEGAFDGPTRKVADLYHRVRIEDRRKNPREHFRLGDLYLRSDGKDREHLIAVMNPDCDLVARPPKGKRGAHSLLTVRGDLQDFDAPQTSVGDFVVINGKPRNIDWNYKAVETFPFSGAMSSAGKSEGHYTYVGALKPMYAQEIQANLLNQLGRVGVAVPPALAFSASLCFTFVCKGGARQSLPLQGAQDTQCYFVPARQSGQVGQAVFKRKFIRDFLETLAGVEVGRLEDADKAQLQLLQAEATEPKLLGLASEGIQLEETVCHGLAVTAKAKYKPTKGIWCWLTLTVDPGIINADALVQLASQSVALEPAVAAAPQEALITVIEVPAPTGQLDLNMERGAAANGMSEGGLQEGG